MESRTLVAKKRKSASVGLAKETAGEKDWGANLGDGVPGAGKGRKKRALMNKSTTHVNA